MAGGGIDNAAGERLNLGSSQIAGNHAGSQGGGIYSDGDATLIADHVTIAGDSAPDGGGLYALGNSTVSITGSRFLADLASGDGGAIDNDGTPLNFSFMSLTNVQITGSRAGSDGGAIYNDEGQLSLTGSGVTRNLAGAGGGGIFSDDSAGFATVTLTSSSVTRNRPDNCEPLNSIPGCAN